MWKNRTFVFKQERDGWTHAQMPVVVQIGDAWRIFYSTRDEQGRSQATFLDVRAGKPENILRYHNCELLSLGDAGTFDETGIMPSCVKKINVSYYMYYAGWSQSKTVPYQLALGVAESFDLCRFSKIFKGAILPPYRNEPYFSSACDIIEHDGKYIMFYMSGEGWFEINGRFEPTYNIKMAVSKDGLTWDRLGTVVPLRNDEAGLAKPSVIQHNGKFYMWFASRGLHNYRDGTENSYRIRCAVSSGDLKEWKRIPDYDLDVSKEGWDSQMVAYPDVIEYEDKLSMFYSGNGFGKEGFGYTTADIGDLR